MSGRVVVENNTGRAIHASGCLTLFQVVLTSSKYHPAVAWPICLQPFTIPAGKSSYPATVEASYNQCSQGRPRGGLRACLPGPRPPRCLPATTAPRSSTPPSGSGSAGYHGACDTAEAGRHEWLICAFPAAPLKQQPAAPIRQRCANRRALAPANFHPS